MTSSSGSEEFQFPASGQILVVDDTPANLKLLVEMLTSQGYQVRAAGSGPLALKSMSVELPDLILLDVRMPGMDGYEVCRLLKEDDRYRDIPVIFLSALNDAAGKVRALEAGAVDYITKPFEPGEVLARINVHLGFRFLMKKMEALVSERTAALVTANQSLIESEERYRMIFEDNVAPMIVVDENAIILMCNRKFEQLCGYTRAEVEGLKKWTEFIATQEDLSKMLEYSRKRRVNSSEAPESYEFQFIDREGTLKTILNRALLLPRTNQSLAMMTDITEQKAAQKAMERSLHEKEVLLQEVFHRVKNNMQIIISMINLQLLEFRSGAMGALLQGLQNRIRSMALIYDYLYQSEEVSRVDFKQYILQIGGLLVRTFEAESTFVEITYELEDLLLGFSQAISCGLIINELVTNSFRHGFPNGRTGTIRISVRRESTEDVVLRVSDNGVGFPSSVDSGKAKEHFGLLLVENLVEQLEGTYTVAGDAGTTFNIRFRV